MTRPSPSSVSARAIWALALPAMLTNLATALFGLADMWVIGRLGDPAAQGAVELGARFMTALLVSFNFLRTGTTALSAQAAGRADGEGQGETLLRALALALAIAAGLLVVRGWVVPVGLGWLAAHGAAARAAQRYIELRYWACPAALVNAVLAGWLIGRRRVRLALASEVIANLAHIALDLGLVLGLHWGTQGVATASAVSEWLKCALLVVMVARAGAGPMLAEAWGQRALWRMAAFRRLLAMNRDLFLRTVLITLVTLLYTRSGARSGAVLLAANGLLFQLFMLSALLLDGFETAAQVLCGEALGGRRQAGFAAAVRANLRWGWVCGAGLSAIYALMGRALVDSFTTSPAVREAALAYMPWAATLPLLGVTSYVMDGVFVGAGWTRAMLATMALAFGVFAGALWLGAGLGNHGLWLAFCLFFVARGGGQLAALPSLVGRSFAGAR